MAKVKPPATLAHVIAVLLGNSATVSSVGAPDKSGWVTIKGMFTGGNPVAAVLEWAGAIKGSYAIQYNVKTGQHRTLSAPGKTAIPSLEANIGGGILGGLEDFMQAIFAKGAAWEWVLGLAMLAVLFGGAKRITEGKP
jgi:hypothetical protein